MTTSIHRLPGRFDEVNEKCIKHFLNSSDKTVAEITKRVRYLVNIEKRANRDLPDNWEQYKVADFPCQLLTPLKGERHQASRRIIGNSNCHITDRFLLGIDNVLGNIKNEEFFKENNIDYNEDDLVPETYGVNYKTPEDALKDGWEDRIGTQNPLMLYSMIDDSELPMRGLICDETPSELYSDPDGCALHSFIILGKQEGVLMCVEQSGYGTEVRFITIPDIIALYPQKRVLIKSP